MAVIVVPRSLVTLFPGMEHRMETSASTVAEAIDELDTRWPGVRDRLCDPGPAIREFINVFVDGQPAGLSTSVGTGSVIHVLPAVAGG